MAYDSDQRIMVAIFSIEDIDIQLLGATYKTLSGSIPETIEDGIYACDSGASPNNSAGFLRQYTRVTSKVQLFCNVYQIGLFIRVYNGSSWTTWKQLQMIDI